jgi:energy-coupling factor transporter ATP-binding protein EcfA2
MPSRAVVRPSRANRVVGGGRVMSIIDIDSLSYKYPNATTKALDNIDFKLTEPGFTAIMGPTGAGKTTFSLTLNGLIPQFYEGTMEGSVHVLGIDTKRYRIQRLVQHVGLVMQDPESQVFGMNVLADVMFGPANLGLSYDEVMARARRALNLVGLVGFDKRSPSDLSGGEKQRLAVASVLAMHPEILVLDEPTSELDPVGREEVYQAVDRLREDGNVTILAIEHSPDEVVSRAENLVVFNEGKMAYIGTPKDIFRNAPKAHDLGIRIPESAELGWKLHEAGIIEQQQIPLTVDEAFELISPWIIERKDRLAKCDTKPCRCDAEGEKEVILSVQDLSHSYSDEIHALRGVSLDVHKGEFIALVGQNGAGKTTLAKHFNGLLRPTKGRVIVDGKDAAGQAIYDLAKVVGYVFQNPDHQIFSATVWEEAAYGLKVQGITGEKAKERVANVLELVGLSDLLELNPFTLSKGDRQKLAVASILAIEPQVLVIDEPTTGLDARGAEGMMTLIDHLNKLGHTVIIITHDMKLVAEYATRVIAMSRGKVIADCTPAELFSNGAVMKNARVKPTSIARLFSRLQELADIPMLITVEDAADFFIELLKS